MEINVFCLPRNEQPAFSSSSGLKSVFEKLHFRDGSVWLTGLTVGVVDRAQVAIRSFGNEFSWKWF